MIDVDGFIKGAGFFLGLTIFFGLLPKKVYQNGREEYINDPKNAYMAADFDNGYWHGTTWIPEDHHIYTKGRSYSFAKGEVVSFDARTRTFHLYDGNTAWLGDNEDGRYYKKCGYPLHIWGADPQPKKKESMFSGWYDS